MQFIKWDQQKNLRHLSNYKYAHYQKITTNYLDKQLEWKSIL